MIPRAGSSHSKKVLFVSTHFPYDFRKSTTGTFKRMRVFLDALKDRVSLHLLFYYPPYLDVDAQRVSETKSALRSEWLLDDFDVTVCKQEREPNDSKTLWARYGSRALTIHRQLGFVCTSGPQQLRIFEECLEDRPDFVFIHRLMCICPALRTRRPLPPMFMDLDDVEHRALCRDISQPPMWGTKRLYYLHLPAMVWGERRGIKLTRKSFVCSALDERYLTHTWKLSNVRAIPNAIHLPGDQPLSRGPVLLFLGGFGYPPNARAAEHLILRIWPLIRNACPESSLVIAGGDPERIACYEQAHGGVEYTGFVDDLEALYARARVVCCPLQTGGGTRIKVIEAAAYGKPVVSTLIGAEGLEFEEGREILLRDDPRDFADACIKLLRDEALCVQIGQAASAKAAKLYDRRNVIRMIQQEIFGSLEATTPG